MNRKPQKRIANKAEIKALVTSKKSFSLQRLMHDLNEIKTQLIPIAGVNAVPLDDDFYEWHGNIKANSKDVYKGAVLHIRMIFPRDYPMSGPKIFVMNNNFTHPNVMRDGSICIDMLEKSKGKYKGWRSGYTVLSILLQLQMFFFDVDEDFLKKQDLKKIKQQVSDMNEFKCPSCQHKGSSNPYPEFLKSKEITATLTQEQYKNEKKKELCCYLRKTTFEENPLGLGITISKIQRTGEIKGLTPCFDFISLKAFTKERIREGLSGERFTHWFPLYFGIEKDKYLNSVTKAISMVTKGNTKEFSPSLVMKVMPKFFNFMCLNIINEQVYNSSKALQILILVYRIMHLLVRRFPEIKAEVNANIEKFIKDPNARIKSVTPNLGDLLVMLTVSDHSLKDLLIPYMDEQMDRQILWIIQDIPEFEEIIKQDGVDEIKLKLCFKCGLIGKQLLLLYNYIINNIIFGNGRKTTDDFVKVLDSNFCTLPDEELDKHRIEINKILKIDNFKSYYKFLGLKEPSDQELNKKLRKSFDNSLAKKYHGEDLERLVPPETQQIELYLKKYDDFRKLITKKKALMPPNDTAWLKMLHSFDIVSRFEYEKPNTEIIPLNIIRFYREKLYERLFFLPNNTTHVGLSRIKNKISQKLYMEFEDKIDCVEDEKFIKTMSLRELYIKLFFEEYVRYFEYIGNFKELYSMLEILGPEIKHFVFYIAGTKTLKSDYNYVRAIISKLINLKYLELVFIDQINAKLLKNLVKGFTNALNEKAAIEHLKLRKNPGTENYSTKDLNVLTIIDHMPSLKVLDLSDLKLDLNHIYRIRNHLYYFKKIEVLNLTSCNIDDTSANELADGIMKAKSLEKLYIANNQMSKGLSNIIYNLAFQPSIKYLDISGNTKCNLKETATSLYKFIKMSNSIQYLICKDINGLNGELNKDFYISLGDSNSLVYLNLSGSGTIINLQPFGMSLAFNALKNGNLTYLNISNCNLIFNNFLQIIESMKISENDHFNWYGYQFNSNISKESSDYFTKHFYCNLSCINAEGMTLKYNININDPKNANIENLLKTLFTNDKNLTTLIFGNSKANGFFFDLFANALKAKNNIKNLGLANLKLTGVILKLFANAFYSGKDNKEKNKYFKIECLDLSNNELGFNGIRVLSEAMKNTNTIKYLNLYHNLLGVNGARKIEELLKVNSSLEMLDIGFNRIKNVGFKSILSGLKNNKKTEVKFLGVKSNFIKKDLFNEVFNEVENNKTLGIDEIEIKNNLISDGDLNSFWTDKFSKSKKKIKTDAFDICYYLVPERLERTILVSGGGKQSADDYAQSLLKKKRFRSRKDKEEDKIGLPLYIRQKRGKGRKNLSCNIGRRVNEESYDTFIEFIVPNSTNKAMSIAAKGQFQVGGKNVKVFKAGSKPTKLFVKPRIHT